MTTTKKKRGDRREIAASAMGMDYAEMLEYQYQSTRYQPALYAVGDHYIMVGTTAEKDRTEKKLGYKFEPHRDAHWQSLAQEHGWTVWVTDTSKALKEEATPMTTPYRCMNGRCEGVLVDFGDAPVSERDVVHVRVPSSERWLLIDGAWQLSGSFGVYRIGPQNTLLAV